MSDLERTAKDLAAAYNWTPDQAREAIRRALEGAGDGPGDWPQWALQLRRDVAAFHAKHERRSTSDR